MKQIFLFFAAWGFALHAVAAAPNSGPSQEETYRFILEKLNDLPKNSSFAQYKISDKGCYIETFIRRGPWSRSLKWNLRDIGWVNFGVYSGNNSRVIALDFDCEKSRERCITHLTTDTNNFRDDAPLNRANLDMYDNVITGNLDDRGEQLMKAFNHMSKLCKNKKELF